MTLRVARVVALVVPLLLVVATVGVVPTYGGGATAKRSVDQTKKMVVKWQGFQKKPKYRKVSTVPGVGQVELTCRPKATMIRIRANDRRAETQMWLAKFESKRGTDRVAVKNVRVFTYATAADDGRGGTGQRSHEGLNQKSPIEDFQKGSAFGVISQRPGRHQDGGGSMALPATAFKLTWYWERFAYPGAQFCKMKLKMWTDTDQQFGLSWHGSAEAERTSVSTTALPGFGEAVLTCEDGRLGEQSIALRTDDPDAFMDYEYITGEGQVSNHVERYSGLRRDPVSGLLGPVDLPHNGMMRIWWSVDGVKKQWLLSSYVVANNDEKPWLNVCEVAAARRS
ncbi:MAG: hypothetical protein WBP61_00400 [Nocardioides sp.]